jgi:4-amino-4-deoxy-L-arabinose transferase-like glycosyltransferase
MNIRSAFVAWLRRSGWAILLIAALQLVLHLWVAAHDNLSRDELYYIAASRHLDFGYVDFPPLVALATAGVRLLLGTSVVAIRLLPALAGVLIVLLTADMVALLGGGLIPQVLAALAVALGPVFIGSSGLMSMDPFDQLWWTLYAWTLLRLIKYQQPRLWLLFGLFAGLGLLNKLTVGFYVAALVLGLLPSNQRKLLFNRWLMFGGLLAFLLISPYILWNAAHGFPTLEFTRNYTSGKTYQQATPLEFLLQQITASNPLALPLWLGALYLLFFTAPGKPYRAFGWAYLFLIYILHAPES